MKPALSIINATKYYGNQQVFSNLNIEFPNEKVSVVYGPSGCGKTTLLKILVLLEPLSKGSIIYNGVKIASGIKVHNEKLIREKIGIVFQDFYLWENKKVIENITESLIYVKGKGRNEAVEKARAMCNKLHIDEELLNKYPPELSRGQRQRIAIARTLVLNPEIILLDEATASLDNFLIDQLIQIIKVLSDMKKTVIIVTHDMNFAKKVGDEVFNLHNC